MNETQFIELSTPREVYREVHRVPSPNTTSHGQQDDDDQEVLRRDSFSSDRVRASISAVPDKGNVDPSRFRGRLVIWPGIVLLVVILALGAALMSTYGIQARDAMLKRRYNAQINRYKRYAIKTNSTNGTIQVPLDPTVELVSPDGQVGNPSVYPPMNCALPNYVSKQGKLFAQGPNGENVQLEIKGLNWYGMETSLGVPFGLWTNDYNGTTVYEVTAFLSRNKINSIRLPLCVESILLDVPPMKPVFNTFMNRAVDITTYFSTISTIVKSLGFRKISVLLDLHTLTPTQNGGLPWIAGTVFTKANYLLAIDMLVKAFCNDEHWNVIGVDLKNEPHLATWGDGSAVDFRDMAETIGNRVVDGCPNWLAFVEGVNAMQQLTMDGTTFHFNDWWGGGLEDAIKHPVRLNVPDKLVYSPHYYTPAVYPQLYFLKSGTRIGDTVVDFTELDDEGLTKRVKATADLMFGHLAGKQDSVIIPGEFGGLYTGDLHPMKTTRRVTEIMMRLIQQPGYAGGYLWALNPESAYQFNPSSTRVDSHEGLLTMNWLDVNMPLLEAMTIMDKMPHLQPFPCFPRKKK